MATPSLLMIPSAFKSGVLASVLPSDGTGDFTVSRPSVATRINSEGLIETMAANVARLDYTVGGCPVLLTEPQSTNIDLWSNDFTQSYWVKSNTTVTSNQITSPDPDDIADLLLDGIVEGRHGIFNMLGSLNLSYYTISIFAKDKDRGFVILNLSNTNGTEYYSIVVDLSNGNVTQENAIGVTNYNYKVVSLKNGWYKISATAQLIPKYTTIAMSDVGVFTPQAFGYNNYLGSNKGIYIYGAFLEEQSYPTSYIKTEGTAVTRLADVVTVTPPVGVTEIIETIDGVEQTPITTIPATYTVPVGNVNSIEMN